MESDRSIVPLNYYLIIGRVYNFFSATLIQQERSILLHPFRKDLHVRFVTRRWSILADRMKHAIQLRCKDNRKKKKKMEAIWDRYARCTDLESTSSFFEARSIFVGDEINQTLALISPPTISRIYSVEVIGTCDCAGQKRFWTPSTANNRAKSINLENCGELIGVAVDKPYSFDENS